MRTLRLLLSTLALGVVLASPGRAADETNGEAMAPIAEINRRHREYSCSACNIEMPFEAVLRLTSDLNTIYPCRACGRILYLEDALRETIGPAPAKK